MEGEGTAASSSGPGDGERLWFLGTLATIKLPGEASGGRFALIEFLFPQHASPPLHTHPQDESYFVLEGRLTIQAGERRFELEAGAAAAVPMGVPHTFRVESATARSRRPPRRSRRRTLRDRRPTSSAASSRPTAR